MPQALLLALYTVYLTDASQKPNDKGSQKTGILVLPLPFTGRWPPTQHLISVSLVCPRGLWVLSEITWSKPLTVLLWTNDVSYPITCLRKFSVLGQLISQLWNINTCNSIFCEALFCPLFLPTSHPRFKVWFKTRLSWQFFHHLLSNAALLPWIACSVCCLPHPLALITCQPSCYLLLDVLFSHKNVT